MFAWFDYNFSRSFTYTVQLYILHGVSEESSSHFFFNCPYNRFLIISLTEHLNFSFWKLLNIPILTQISPDIRMEDLTEVLQKFTHHSPLGQLLCNAIGCLSYYIWMERNRRFIQHTPLGPWSGFYKVIKDINLSFRSEG